MGHFCPGSLDEGKNIMDAPIEWLLAGEPYIEYRTRCDLLGQSENTSQVVSARNRMLESQPVKNLLTGLSN